MVSSGANGNFKDIQVPQGGNISVPLKQSPDLIQAVNGIASPLTLLFCKISLLTPHPRSPHDQVVPFCQEDAFPHETGYLLEDLPGTIQPIFLSLVMFSKPRADDIKK